MPKCSIIIPVFNQWDLTRQCLKTLAATTAGRDIEVIVVDNASSDPTPKAAPFLGGSLFGDRFQFIRNEENRNFAGATNQGARASKGEYLVFLNNDTELLPGWLDPVLDDFRKFSNIAASGPLLVYPAAEPFGQLVQHLGVSISPWFRPFHLYDGIPIDSPMVSKRRFFQAITAACMVMPRDIFFGAEMFDERYKNGYEDVDLCARLKEKGFRFTVNPEARVIHHTSMTPGRFVNEIANSNILKESSLMLFRPDMQDFYEADGYRTILTPWQDFRGAPDKAVTRRLDALLPELDADALRARLVEEPFWEKGWLRFFELSKGKPWLPDLIRSVCLFDRSPDKFILGCQECLDRKNKRSALAWLTRLEYYCGPFETLKASARSSAFQLKYLKLDDLDRQRENWLANAEKISSEELAPVFKEYCRLARELEQPLDSLKTTHYAAWRAARKTAAPKDDESAGFSILMPVYNPDPAFLREALDSVLAQTHQNWELCIADDASTEPAAREIIEEYRKKDPRVKAVYRSENGHIAAATNSALELASMPWAALMDQDDLLAPDALARVAEAISARPGAALFYSDEDMVTADGEFYDPYFKANAWDPEFILSQNFVCHLAVYEMERLKKIGGFRDGFAGAQDHDLILRFTADLPPERIAHIPHILYHWRSHDKSTAKNINSKPYALESARKAVQDRLDELCPGAACERIQGFIYPIVKYPRPKDNPSADIIIDMRPGDSPRVNDFPESANPVFVGDARTLESSRKLFGKRARFVEIPEGMNWPQRMNYALEQCEGRITAFLSPSLIPAGAGWFEELVSCLWRKEIGACGPRVLRPDGKLENAGYYFDRDGVLKPFFPGCAPGQARWRCFDWLARTVAALDGSCLFTKRDLFMELGGLDAAMGDWALQDLCLRLGEKGMRSIWFPYASFVEASDSRRPGEIPEAFRKRWFGKFPPYNENVMGGPGGFQLCTD